MRLKLSFSLLLATLAIQSSCVYTSTPALSRGIKSCHVGLFVNTSGYPGLNAKLKAALTRSFLLDGTMRPVGSNADAKLEGRVLRVNRRSLQEDAYDDTLTGSVELVVSITLTGPNGEVLLKNERVSSRDVFKATGTYRLDLGVTEASGLDSATVELARNIVRRCVEVW